MNPCTFLQDLARAVGDSNVLVERAEKAPYLTDWRRLFTGQALAVVRPATTLEVAEVMKVCSNARVPIVPQGGNTGQVGGATPSDTNDSIVLSLGRLNAIREVDTANNTVTAEAGVILQNLQQAARDVDRIFPLSLAAEGSCSIGGNLATNAGGTAVLRYGNARDLCLGLEVVTQTGLVWNGLRGLRKDNTGYDLRDLYIGSEGTLGVITAAVLKLYPTPRSRVTALAGLKSAHAATDLLEIAQANAGPLLTGFELISGRCVELVKKHFPSLRYPLSGPFAYLVLLELTDYEPETHAGSILEQTLGVAFERDVVADAAVAESMKNSIDFWNLRERVPLA
jgi:FAD/FMN-containing dehydrogenase